jgi:hypothetical protein
MGMTVHRAMLLSSKGVAQLTMCYPGIYVAQKPRYQLRAIRETAPNCRLEIFAFKPQTEGPPIRAEHPHLEERFTSRVALSQFLYDYDIPVEGWEPEEDTEGKGDPPAS